ncbi:alpha/beta fold hydrolase [Rubripirellula obstinata]
MKFMAQDVFPYASKQHQVAGGVIRYIDEGPSDEEPIDEEPEDKDVILCVHGNPTWSFYYRRVVERFKETHRVIAVDHLGCGRSDRPSQSEFEYTLAAHRDNMLSLIDHLNLDRMTLLAHDWGGAIGLSTLVARRERFKRIMLLNTAAFPPPYVPWRIAACRFPVLGTAAVRGLNAFAKAAITMAMSRNKLDPKIAAGLLAPYDNWHNRVAIDAFVRDIPMSKSHPTFQTLTDLESALPSLADMPSLLVWGMKDWCFRPECLRRFQQAWPNAKSLEIADAGHYVIEDAPSETIEAIAGFLSETS